ncbi:MAG: hypothetical protein EHM37_08930 [Deltaproteobacteria bacterium]|nr:MAG: hypothetical protein EHM37_08930 [Deltaproteobacteria bacterium]
MGCRDFGIGQRIDDLQTAHPANGLAEADQLLPVELIDPAEVVDDFGDRLASIRMPLVMGELVILDDRAVQGIIDRIV